MEHMYNIDSGRYSVKGLCHLFGYSVQAYHKRRKSGTSEPDGYLLIAAILEFCRADARNKAQRQYCSILL